MPVRKIIDAVRALAWQWLRRRGLGGIPSSSPDTSVVLKPASSNGCGQASGEHVPVSASSPQTKPPSTEVPKVRSSDDGSVATEAVSGNSRGKTPEDRKDFSQEALVSQPLDDEKPATPRNDPGSDKPAVLVEPESSSSRILPKENAVAKTDHTEDKGKTREAKHESPRNIGGRRRSSAGSRSRQPRQPPVTRPELICRRTPGSWQWEVVLSTDDECRIKEACLDDAPLDMSDSECSLPSLTGRLTVVYEDGEEDELPLFDGNPLIFKLRNDWEGDGRRVDGVTKGYFIVIAPKEWKRKGYARVKPEGCTDGGFTAHYFKRSGTKPTEDIGNFEEREVVIASGFELVGKRVFDDSEHGELFVEDVPSLKLPRNISRVRVGEERQGGWKGENFNPSERTLADILGSREGRFFVRVYDEDRLRDNGQFRYLRDLREIQVNGERYTEHTLLVPHAKGHPSTKVHFVGVSGITVHPILPPDSRRIEVRGNGLVVEPHPDGDDISCRLESDTVGVDIVLNLPRIWWRLERDPNEVGEWCSTPLVATRREFREYADVNGTMRLRLPRRVKSIRVGFNDGLERKYPRKNEEEGISIPLDHFVDYPQIGWRLNEDASFNVECNGEALTLIRVSADPVPEIVSFKAEPTTVTAGEKTVLRWITRNVEPGNVEIVINPEIGTIDSDGIYEVMPFKTSTYTLKLIASGMDDVTKTVTVVVDSPSRPGEKPTARVKRTDGRWRYGKGFSHGELLDVGWAAACHARRSMRIDKRRRSVHSVNVETIRRWIDA